MDSSFHRTIYSRQFNLLKLWGSWPLEKATPLQRKFHKAYGITYLVIMSFFTYMGVGDFIMVIGDFRKIAWNMCVNVGAVGTIFKNIRNLQKRAIINRLRRNLHRDVASCRDEEELRIYEESVAALRSIMKFFHYPFLFFYPLWLLYAIYSFIQTEELPLPLAWPGGLTGLTEEQKWCIVTCHFVMAAVLLVNAMTTDLAMFGLMLQISREYKFLLKMVSELNDYCQQDDEGSHLVDRDEVDECHRKETMKTMLKKIILRQRELIEYTEDYELSYSATMLPQLFVGGFLVILNCIQTLTLSLEFDFKMTPQGAYVTVITLDILLMCYLGNQITDDCMSVGEALYNIPWYYLDTDLRKDLLFVILRSNKPARITAGRFVNLNLETYSETMKNVYRWLTVFRQLGFS